MIYRKFANIDLSLLGFGTMRFPSVNGVIDIPQTEAMFDLAIKNGVNYFDTAYPYHGGKSEIITGNALSAYPRDKWYLASKFPGHQISERYDPKAIFEEQLKKCRVDYFDFYLLHNVYEGSVATYESDKWGILDYFLEQKKNGRIRHLGFSSHAHYDTLASFLDRHGEDMEFCQLQLNYLDWTLQDGKKKVDLLNKLNIPVWVMEPVRGGKLAKLPENLHNKLAAVQPDRTNASWAFRFLQGIDGIGMILSGMSSLEQMQDNLNTFNTLSPLSDAENKLVLDIAEELKDAVPCTGCRYCCDGCPMGLDIPTLINAWNDLGVTASFNTTMFLETLPKDKQPAACVNCGQCAAICPQKIDIPDVLSRLADKFASMPTWAQICKERDEAAKKNK